MNSLTKSVWQLPSTGTSMPRSLTKAAQVAGLDRTDFLALAREGEAAFVVDFADLERDSNVAESAVVNASPSFSLRARFINVQQLISVELIVPESVATETEIRGKRDPAAQSLTIFLAWLGLGESLVLAGAFLSRLRASIDDLAAADALGLLGFLFVDCLV